MPDYPKTVAEVLVLNMKFRPEALRAVKRFARSKPWRGTFEERFEKFEQLNRELAAAYGIEPPHLIFEVAPDGDSGASCFIPSLNTIILRGKLSVVTYLHEFAHSRGLDERAACRWSVNLFLRSFPKSFSRCQFDGHLIRNAEKYG